MAGSRADNVEIVVKSCRDVIAAEGVSRESLAGVLAALEGLAAQTGLWNAEDYPPPEPEEPQSRYLISEDADQSFALYLNLMRPGKRVPPHNHTTWACIAAVEGCEHNHLYERLDDGATPGRAEVRQTDTVRVEPGQGIALLPDDIHSVEIEGDQIIRHLHFYGRSLETLDRRLTFDLDAKTCKIMDIGVKTRR
jgi:predicted metal-dependent enzyme (double-stranded beta helix superfamily)